MNRTPKWVNFKFSGDGDSCTGHRPMSTAPPVPKPLTYRRITAKANFISGGGSEVKEGMQIFVANFQGYPTYTVPEMSIERLRSGVDVEY